MGQRGNLSMVSGFRLLLLSVLLISGLSCVAPEETVKLRIAFMKHPITEASLDILDAWGMANDVEIVRIPIAYEVFHEKVTAILTAGGQQYDIVWHNDDWGQIWKKWLEPTMDVAGMGTVDRWAVDIAFGDDELPATWDELVKIGRRLQDTGKVRWGFVGGMTMNHTWFTWLWTAWSNNCDVFLPPFERDPAKLAEAGWTPMMDRPCQQQVVEFWWDAINTHRISPRGMPAYSRNDANAIFLAGTPTRFSWPAMPPSPWRTQPCSDSSTTREEAGSPAGWRWRVSRWDHRVRNPSPGMPYGDGRSPKR
jgi:hypothetical protein